MRTFLCAVLCGALSLPALAALKAGDTAPDFSTQASLNGKAFTYSLRDALKKGPVVVYFYPSAYTGGCNAQAHAFAGFLASFYGGIVEEVELRLFFTTLLAWLLYLLCGKNRAPWQRWSAVVLAALAFGAGHLPAAAQVWPLDSVVIARTVLLNAIAGLVFGWFYVRQGLESAMLSHFCADLVLHVATPLAMA